MSLNPEHVPVPEEEQSSDGEPRHLRIVPDLDALPDSGKTYTDPDGVTHTSYAHLNLSGVRAELNELGNKFPTQRDILVHAIKRHAMNNKEKDVSTD